jgi:hypothetical protein
MIGSGALGQFALGEGPSTAAAVAAGTGAFTLTGRATLRQLSIQAGAASFALTGQDTRRTLSIRAGAGAITLTGRAVSLERGYRLAVQPTLQTYGRHSLFAALGELPLGGATTGTEQATTFLFTGNNVGFERAASFQAETGVFTFTGSSVAFIVQGYPSKIRAFPRVAFGMRAGARGSDPIVAKPSIGTSPRARAFGG